jgi:hypothetical protein
LIEAGASVEVAYKSLGNWKEKFEKNMKMIAADVIAVLLQKKRLTEANFLREKNGEPIPLTPLEQAEKKTEDVMNGAGEWVKNLIILASSGVSEIS